MPRVALALVCLLQLTSCGGVTAGGFFFNPVSTISGEVSIVQITVVSGPNGTSVQVTAVTFINNGSANSMNFCGNVAKEMPVGSFVTVSFNPGSACGSVISVQVGH